MKKIKNLIKDNRVAIIASVSSMAMGLVTTSAHAVETVPDMTTVIITSFQSIVTQTLQTIAAIAPIGITVFAAFFCWKKGVAFFKTATKG